VSPGKAEQHYANWITYIPSPFPAMSVHTVPHTQGR
jgi:hypothetical protein